jgi:V-type H+-transporting ATPase subunit a
LYVIWGACSLVAFVGDSFESQEPEQYTKTEFSTWLTNQRDTLSREHRGLSLLDYWESILNERHADYQGIKTARDETAARLYQVVQRRLVIEHAKDFFLEAAAGRGASTQRPSAAAPTAYAPMDVERGSSAANDEDDMQFKHIAGIIATDDKVCVQRTFLVGSLSTANAHALQVRFARILFRASAGHAVIRFADIAEPLIDDKGVKQTKSVFAIFYRGRTLTAKLDKICSAFSAHQHDIPSFDNEQDVARALEETRRAMEDSITWLKQEAESSSITLRHLSLLIRKWRTGAQREKAIYFTLNMFLRAPERGTVSAQAWVLKSAVQQVHETIQDAHASAAQGGRVQPFYLEVVKGDQLPAPPTHFHVNKITRVYQGIVNTYGVPRYGEANPALFSIITFPFLFGVMYGDIGHATVLTLASAYMVWKEEQFLSKKLGEMFGMCFKGRYMLLMMGLFSIYCGLIYNDLFSIATTTFGATKWHYPHHKVNSTLANGTIVIKTIVEAEAVKDHGYDDVYAFGVDPEWHFAENDLLFFNSLKMKMSVIFGITQMTFGLFLKLSNALHFKSKADLYLEVLPQIIFMVGLFGYMVLLIVLKWCIDWNDPLSAPGAPPSLIDTLINLALKPGFVLDPMYEGQAKVQVFILLVVFFCVPIMLLGKPLLFKYGKKSHSHEEASPLIEESKQSNPAAGTALASGSTKENGTHAAEPVAVAGHDEHGFGEIFIHSAIETIEFVLGSVSNTASYLRLWALSLAHSQLATVFWERALVATIEMDSPVFVFIGFAVWAGISFGVLMCMDVLECFLHALRLHWVEFQNKFYKADGYKFTPFSFQAIAEVSD